MLRVIGRVGHPQVRIQDLETGVRDMGRQGAQSHKSGAPIAPPSDLDPQMLSHHGPLKVSRISLSPQQVLVFIKLVNLTALVASFTAGCQRGLLPSEAKRVDKLQSNQHKDDYLLPVLELLPMCRQDGMIHTVELYEWSKRVLTDDIHRGVK